MKQPPASLPLRLDVVAVLVGTLVGAVTLVPAWGLYHGYATPLWVWFAVFLAWNGLSITAGYHRLWAHKSFEAHWIVRLIFALGGALSLQNSIRQWCSNHRHHHQYVDDDDNDPYSANRGLFYSHIGWMLKDYPAAATDYSNVKDLDRDPIVRWQDKYYLPLTALLNIGVPMAIGAFYGDAIGGLLLIGLLRLVISHHTTWFINSLAHAWGRQPYSDEHTARDNPIVALLTYGEGYHNFHHTFQWDYRNGVRWYQFDPTKWLIKALSYVRLTSSLKRATPEKIERRLVEMQRKRTTERLYGFHPDTRQQWLDLIESEYAALVETLNAFAQCRQQWLALNKAKLIEKWEKTEVRSRLKELEAELAFQRRQWRLLTRQFA